MEKYVSEKCNCCGQTLTYLLPIDKGTADIIRAFSIVIRRKGINMVHPWKEMLVETKKWSRERMLSEGVLTASHLTNLSKGRAHGLIAKAEEPKNWVLTTKGAQFLKGSRIPKYAILSKVTKHQEGYWRQDELTVSVQDFIDDDEYWEGINYSIIGGRVVMDLPEKNPGQMDLFKINQPVFAGIKTI